MRIFVLICFVLLTVYVDAKWRRFFQAGVRLSGHPAHREHGLEKFKHFFSRPWPVAQDKEKNCVENAIFEKGNCTCKEGHEGDGYFCCHRPDIYHDCRISNDPGMKTFGGQGTLVHPIGSMLLAKICTERRVNDKRQGKCHMSVNGWVERVVGKVYIKGIEFDLYQENKSGSKNKVSFKISSETEADGSYSWEISSREHPSHEFSNPIFFTTKNPLTKTTIHFQIKWGCLILFTLAKQHFLNADIACCGMVIGFRQFHIMYPFAVPGFFFLVNKTYEIYPKPWDMNNLPLCLDPDKKALGFADVIKWTRMSEAKDAMTYLSIINVDFARATNVPPGQAALARVLKKSCSKSQRAALFKDVGFFLRTPPFTRCITYGSEGLDQVIELLISYTKWFCVEDVVSCVNFQYMINSRCERKIEKYSKLKNIMKAKCQIP